MLTLASAADRLIVRESRKGSLPRLGSTVLGYTDLSSGLGIVS